MHDRPFLSLVGFGRERAHELGLLGSRLEATVSKLGGSIDKLEVDLFLVDALGEVVGHERLAEGDDALLGADNGALEHDPVLVDHTVVRESAHGVDALLGQVVLGRGALGSPAFPMR